MHSENKAKAQSASHYEQITEEFQVKPDSNHSQRLSLDKHEEISRPNTTINIENYDSFIFDRVIEIEKPQVIKEGYLISYKLYTIKSRKKDSEYYDTIVHRRFNDFQFLDHELIEHYGGCVLPKLPEKNILAKFDIEEKQFQESRMKLLENYLTILLNHNRVRYSLQLRNFLFIDDIKFSFKKGKFAQESAFSSQLNDIKSSVLGVSKLIYQKIVGSKEHLIQFCKQSQEQQQLKLFQRQIQDLMKIIKEIKQIVEQSYQQFKIILDINEGEGMSNGMNKKESDYHQRFKDIIAEFQQITVFVNNCFDAIHRTKHLRTEIQDLEDNLKSMEVREKNNPRNLELDIIRGQIEKKSIKSQKWLCFLKKQLQIYTSQGKTLMQQFVKKFNVLKGEVYTFFND